MAKYNPTGIYAKYLKTKLKYPRKKSNIFFAELSAYARYTVIYGPAYSRVRTMYCLLKQCTFHNRNMDNFILSYAFFRIMKVLVSWLQEQIVLEQSPMVMKWRQVLFESFLITSLQYIGFSNVLNVIFEFQNRFCSYKYQKINCTFDGFVVSISFQVQL